jgi:hexulose-6-phosphate isomerase
MFASIVKIAAAQFTAAAAGADLLKRTAALGFAGLEPMIDAADSPYLTWTSAEIMQFMRAAKKMNLALPTTAVSHFNGDDALINLDGHKNAISLLRRALAFSALIGAKAMLLCTFFASHPDTRQKKSHLFELLRQLEPTARDLGVAIALETPLPAAELIKMIDVLESEFIGVYYDVGNAVYLGYDPVAEIEMLGRRILSVHVKDSAQHIGDAHLKQQGKLDLDAAMAALHKIDYQGWLVVETPAGDDAALRQDIAIIRQYLR